MDCTFNDFFFFFVSFSFFFNLKHISCVHGRNVYVFYSRVYRRSLIIDDLIAIRKTNEHVEMSATNDFFMQYFFIITFKKTPTQKPVFTAVPYVYIYVYKHATALGNIIDFHFTFMLIFRYTLTVSCTQ